MTVLSFSTRTVVGADWMAEAEDVASAMARSDAIGVAAGGFRAFRLAMVMEVSGRGKGEG
jgi:hypothetical protein